MDQAVAQVTLPFERVLELDSIWPFVSRGLDKCRAVCGDTPWTNDQMRACIEDGFALYAREDAFLILEQCNERVSKRKYLFVWALWAEPMKALSIRPQIVRFLDAVKQSNGCEWIDFCSPRSGWYCMPSGFEPITTVWRRK